MKLVKPCTYCGEDRSIKELFTGDEGLCWMCEEWTVKCDHCGKRFQPGEYYDRMWCSRKCVKAAGLDPAITFRVGDDTPA